MNLDIFSTLNKRKTFSFNLLNVWTVISWVFSTVVLIIVVLYSSTQPFIRQCRFPNMNIHQQKTNTLVLYSLLHNHSLTNKSVIQCIRNMGQIFLACQLPCLHITHLLAYDNSQFRYIYLPELHLLHSQRVLERQPAAHTLKYNPPEQWRIACIPAPRYLTLSKSFLKFPNQFVTSE